MEYHNLLIDFKATSSDGERDTHTQTEKSTEYPVFALIVSLWFKF